MNRYRQIYSDLRNHNGRLKSALSTLAILYLSDWTVMRVDKGTAQVQLHGKETGMPDAIMLAGSMDTLVDACQASMLHALNLMDANGKPNMPDMHIDKDTLDEILKGTLSDLGELEPCENPDCPIHGAEARAKLN